MIVTPGQLTHRAEFYHQLSQTTAAGLPIIRALEQLERNPPTRAYRAPIQRTLERLGNGYSLADSLQVDGWLPPLDMALLRAGEQSGRLPPCFRQLSDHYRERARLIRRTLLALAYPLFILHLAFLIFPLDRLTGLILRGEVIAFLLQKFMVVGPLWGIIVLALYTSQIETSGWRALVERLLHVVPVLGRARRCLAIARLSSALEALISAGVNILDAWELAVNASASPALQRALNAARPQLAAGTTPAEMVRASSEFPRQFADMYQTGEISGKLDESLERARGYFQEEGSRKLAMFIVFCCGVVMFAIVLLVAWQIIHFYMGYFQQINDATQGI